MGHRRTRMWGWAMGVGLDHIRVHNAREKRRGEMRVAVVALALLAGMQRFPSSSSWLMNGAVGEEELCGVCSCLNSAIV